MPQVLDIRLARVADAAVIGWHRARMLGDMGLVPKALFDSYRAKVGWNSPKIGKTFPGRFFTR